LVPKTGKTSGAVRIGLLSLINWGLLFALNINKLLTNDSLTIRLLKNVYWSNQRNHLFCYVDVLPSICGTFSCGYYSFLRELTCLSITKSTGFSLESRFLLRMLNLLYRLRLTYSIKWSMLLRLASTGFFGSRDSFLEFFFITFYSDY
jgi:hypothetical protein